MVDIAALEKANEARWSRAKITRDFAKAAKRLVAPEAKAHYVNVSKATGVPWAFIAVVHERECSQSWTGSLAQGDPWNQVSTHVPKGRGPFKSWEDAAIDALTNCSPYAARNKDWSVGSTLTLLEQYNGLGYAGKGKPSPYIWSGTDQYVSGKYIRDGVYDANVVDQQLGCAGLLKAMMQLDSSIAFPPASAPAKPDTAVAAAPAQPSITAPARGSIGAFIASIVTAIFTRKS